MTIGSTLRIVYSRESEKEQNDDFDIVKAKNVSLPLIRICATVTVSERAADNYLNHFDYSINIIACKEREWTDSLFLCVENFCKNK